MFRFLRRLCADESGPTAVEYAVMLALIVAVCLVSIQAMARATAESFDASSNEIAEVFGS
jgi:pilus assembly protein Flp/PilA